MHLPDTIEHLPIGGLLPYARNSRTHSPEQIGKVADSIRRFGFTNPVLIRGNGIVAGHGRVMAARQLGLDTVPVIRLDHLTEDEARAYVIADNKLAELAGWDDDLLALELRDLQEHDFDLALTGFSDDELKELLFVEPEAKADADAAPAVQEVAVSKSGDVWLMGKHRIMCGDALKRDTYATLMERDRADLLVTDPPWGVAYNANKKGDRGASIEGDLTQAAIPVSFALCLENMTEDANCYLFGGVANWPMYGALFDHHLRMQPRACIWVKEGFILRPNGYHSQFEIVFWGWKGRGGGKEAWFGDRKASDVWQVRRDNNSEREHPTQKPVDVYRIPIVNSAPRDGIVLEPFSGSGVCIIACEMTGRQCRAIELSPHYVDVAVRRWQQYTGRRAVHAVTGEPFPG